MTWTDATAHQAHTFLGIEESFDSLTTQIARLPLIPSFRTGVGQSTLNTKRRRVSEFGVKVSADENADGYLQGEVHLASVSTPTTLLATSTNTLAPSSLSTAGEGESFRTFLFSDVELSSSSTYVYTVSYMEPSGSSSVYVATGSAANHDGVRVLNASGWGVASGAMVFEARGKAYINSNCNRFFVPNPTEDSSGGVDFTKHLVKDFTSNNERWYVSTGCPKTISTTTLTNDPIGA